MLISFVLIKRLCSQINDIDDESRKKQLHALLVSCIGIATARKIALISLLIINEHPLDFWIYH